MQDQSENKQFLNLTLVQGNDSSFRDPGTSLYYRHNTLVSSTNAWLKEIPNTTSVIWCRKSYETSPPSSPKNLHRAGTVCKLYGRELDEYLIKRTRRRTWFLFKTSSRTYSGFRSFNDFSSNGYLKTTQDIHWESPINVCDKLTDTPRLKGSGLTRTLFHLYSGTAPSVFFFSNWRDSPNVHKVHKRVLMTKIIKQTIKKPQTNP